MIIPGRVPTSQQRPQCYGMLLLSGSADTGMASQAEPSVLTGPPRAVRPARGITRFKITKRRALTFARSSDRSLNPRAVVRCVPTAPTARHPALVLIILDDTLTCASRIRATLRPPLAAAASMPGKWTGDTASQPAWLRAFVPFLPTRSALAPARMTQQLHRRPTPYPRQPSDPEFLGLSRATPEQSNPQSRIRSESRARTQVDHPAQARQSQAQLQTPLPVQATTRRFQYRRCMRATWGTDLLPCSGRALREGIIYPCLVFREGITVCFSYFVYDYSLV
mmetsp:Transcript_44698/g.103247  ORF Transcript_44698/g.103247 Transcript_44698/m.103247 type:complete len:280 (+) Transcript_44698:232-1071(+)